MGSSSILQLRTVNYLIRLVDSSKLSLCTKTFQIQEVYF